MSAKAIVGTAAATSSPATTKDASRDNFVNEGKEQTSRRLRSAIPSAREQRRFSRGLAIGLLNQIAHLSTPHPVVHRVLEESRCHPGRLHEIGTLTNGESVRRVDRAALDRAARSR